MTRKLVELGGRPERILTLPKGVDTSVFTPGPTAARDAILISTRQFRPEYRHELILQAVALARLRVPGMKYILCGDGPCRGQLERLTEQLGITSLVEFHGRVAHAELPARLREAQVYVSVIPEDGVSASLLEAMACGAFPIVPDIEPNRDWIRTGVDGFLVQPGDTAALADRIVDAFTDHALRLAARTHNLNAVVERGSMASNMRQMERSDRSLLSPSVIAHA
jgi:glycosyltransferase involved in cell wall biosynthesis